MTDAQKAAMESNPALWLRAQVEAIMGPAGADYWCEPVTVYAVLADMIEERDHRIARASEALRA